MVSQVETNDYIFPLQKGFHRLSIIVIRKKGTGQNLNQKSESVMEISIFWKRSVSKSVFLSVTDAFFFSFFLWTHKHNPTHILMIQVHFLLFYKCLNNDFLLGSAKTQVTYT